MFDSFFCQPTVNSTFRDLAELLEEIVGDSHDTSTREGLDLEESVAGVEFDFLGEGLVSGRVVGAQVDRGLVLLLLLVEDAGRGGGRGFGGGGGGGGGVGVGVGGEFVEAAEREG